MLAFNLGVFFRNLHGEEVVFSAENRNCTVHFTGGVEEVSEKTDLTHELSVTLARGSLTCHIVIEDEEEPDEEENPEVRVRLVSKLDIAEETLLETVFRFNEVKLQPRSAEDEVPPETPAN